MSAIEPKLCPLVSYEVYHYPNGKQLPEAYWHVEYRESAFREELDKLTEMAAFYSRGFVPVGFIRDVARRRAMELAPYQPVEVAAPAEQPIAPEVKP